MTPFEWFQVAQTIVMGVATAVAWVIGRAQKQSEIQVQSLKDKMQLVERLLQELDGRFDRLPESLRQTFMSNERASDFFSASAKDRERIWDEMRRQFAEVWTEFRARGSRDNRRMP